LNIRPLSVRERERYQVDWATVQGKFVDQPAEATQEADHLIMEVMALRDYPVSDFEQRAADISVKYPALVTNYRAAREIAIKNKNHKASTEELRQALIYTVPYLMNFSRRDSRSRKELRIDVYAPSRRFWDKSA